MFDDLWLPNPAYSSKGGLGMSLRLANVPVSNLLHKCIPSELENKAAGMQRII